MRGTRPFSPSISSPEPIIDRTGWGDPGGRRGRAGRRPTSLAGASFWTVTMAPPGPLQTVPPAHASLGAFSAPLAHSGWHAHKQAQTLQRALTRTDRREGCALICAPKCAPARGCASPGSQKRPRRNAQARALCPSPPSCPAAAGGNRAGATRWQRSRLPGLRPGPTPAGPGAGALGTLARREGASKHAHPRGPQACPSRPGHMTPDR